MPRIALASAVAATALLVVPLLLTGCAPQPTATPTKKAAHSVSPSPTASPTSTAAPLAADVLFQISATASSPDGATAHLVEVVHVPVTATSTQAADETQLDTECDSWRNAYTPTKFLVGQVTTTVTSGTWDSDNIVATDMASYPVWSGDQRPFQAYCASALPSIPGSARAVSPVGGGDPDTNGGWGIYRYGFSVPTDPSVDQRSAAPSDVVLSACQIQLSSAAADSVFAGTWPTTAQTDGGLSCLFGGT